MAKPLTLWELDACDYFTMNNDPKDIYQVAYHSHNGTRITVNFVSTYDNKKSLTKYFDKKEALKIFVTKHDLKIELVNSISSTK